MKHRFKICNISKNIDNYAKTVAKVIDINEKYNKMATVWYNKAINSNDYYLTLILKDLMAIG